MIYEVAMEKRWGLTDYKCCCAMTELVVKLQETTYVVVTGLGLLTKKLSLKKTRNTTENPNNEWYL